MNKSHFLAALGVAATTAVLFPVGSASAQFFAIATDDVTGAWGAAWDYGTQYDAELSALEKCDGDCRVEVSVYNGCGAIAEDDNWYGTGSGDTREEAVENALEACDGAFCSVKVSNCSWDY